MKPAIHFHFSHTVLGTLKVAQSGLGAIRTLGVGAGINALPDGIETITIPAMVVAVASGLKMMLDTLIDLSTAE